MTKSETLTFTNGKTILLPNTAKALIVSFFQAWPAENLSKVSALVILL
jgi:hypothetical protein